MPVAPEFLNQIRDAGQNAMTWAQSMSAELEREYCAVKTPEDALRVRERVDQFIANLEQRERELAPLDQRIRRVYRQIRPTRWEGVSVTRADINEEMFLALEAISKSCRTIENILRSWKFTHGKRVTLPSPPNLVTRESDVSSVNSDEKGLVSIDLDNSSVQINSKVEDDKLLSEDGTSGSVIPKKMPFLGISKWQRVVLIALGLGVLILYCVLCMLVFRMLSWNG